MTGPLLSTKFFIPRPRLNTVDRPRLTELLDRGAQARLTLVSAPAGFGKTTAVAGWVHQGPGLDSVAWLSLGDADADPDTFWTSVVTALSNRVPDLGESVLPLVGVGKAPGEPMLTELLNRLADAPEAVYLVLDDYHLVNSPDVAAGMAFFIGNLPLNVHVLLSTRADPDLPLGRLRSRGEVVEVRASELRFTTPEASGYLRTAGLDLSPSDLTVLAERTEGWVAALQLAALSMRDRPDVTEFIADFAGDDRFIVDYLVEEVLARQHVRVREFLVRTSILDQLTGPLCDAVTGQADGETTLYELDRTNLFIVPLDARRRWYRYHHLFADVLRTHLGSEQDGPSVAELHSRASRWYEQDAQTVPAVRHSLAAGDHHRAAALMEVAIPELMRQRQEATVCGWVDALPDDVVQARPVLAMGFVAALMSRSQFDSVPRRLQALEPLLTPAPDARTEPLDLPSGLVRHDQSELPRLAGKAALYRAGLALVAGDNESTHRLVRRVADLSAPDDHVTRAGGWGLSGLAHWNVGELEAAHQCYTKCVDGLERAGHISDVLGCSITLADLRVTQGRLSEAQATYERALELASREPGVLRGTPDMHTGLSLLFLERNDIAAAEAHLRRAQELGEPSGLPQHPYRVRVAMARLRQAHGDMDEALALLEEAERVYVGDFLPNVRPVHATRARALVATGRLAGARAWAAALHLSGTDELTYAREYEHVTLAMLLLADHEARPSAGSLGDAVDLLRRLHDDTEAGGRTGTLVEVLVLQSLAHHAQGDLEAAATFVERALTLGEPEGFARVFTQHGAALPPLLHLLPEPMRNSTYVKDLLAACAPADGAAVRGRRLEDSSRQALVDPLSQRELEVLRLLDSDLSGPDLARHLVVSLNTLRTHTNHIYAKLGVSGRRAAVRRARELDLLSRGRP